MTAFCQGMGTASSVLGVSDALRPHGVFIQAHEPAGSAAITGGERGTFVIQGWTGMVMPHWSPEKVDHVEPIGDDEAMEMTLGSPARRASSPASRRARTWSARIVSPSASARTR